MRKNDVVIYESDDGQALFKVNVFDETVWLNQQEIALLFQKAKSTINEHIKNIYMEGELDESSTIKKFGISEFQQKIPNYYNLDVIISVGYRVKSKRGIHFRKWATTVLKSYLINGYSINQKRIKDIESKIDNLSADLRSELKKEIQEIHKSLLEIAKKPIIINNNLFSKEAKLEEKIINLIDEIILRLQRNNKETKKLEKAKTDVSLLSKDKQAKNRLLNFFKEVGDDKSEIHKTIKGTSIAKNIVTEFVSLGNKLRDLL